MQSVGARPAEPLGIGRMVDELTPLRSVHMVSFGKDSQLGEVSVVLKF
jgi:hypothetical protein